MRLTRLYLPQLLHSGATISLNGERAHYLRSVLRLKSGAQLQLFNGEGGEYSATLQTVERSSVTLLIGEWQQCNVESRLTIELGLAVSRGERMEYAIQKAVELGVSSIVPLWSRRCVVRLRGSRLESKRDHWQGIARSAAEQSGRDRLPEITAAVELNHWLASADGERIILDPTAGQPLSSLNPSGEQFSILSGPEGGFTEEERVTAIASGFSPVLLGPRVLRCETAAVTVIAAIQALWGDF